MEAQTVLIPAKITAQILSAGAQELLGVDRCQCFFPSPANGNNSFTFTPSFGLEEMAAFTRQLEAAYGVQGGRGLALRIGRASFKYGLQMFGEETGLYSLAFRLLPVQRRLETGLGMLSQIISVDTGDAVRIDSQADFWLWRQSSGGTMLSSLHAPEPACYPLVGLLQDFLQWADSGRFYPAVECAGSAVAQPESVIRIGKKALD
jgi:hypothetical protein